MEMLVSDVIEAAGGLTKLAKAVGVSAPSVAKWRKRNFIPTERIPAVAKAANVEIAAICPDPFNRTPTPEGANVG